ncbi:PII uridylyl-transferase [Knoellia sinensis KCTC 19936]|uniref:Bifunctional uridylyltransferase/uridylyl-removing enzyme n=1 Tax=Knoellia sinensis KCTC 19936 TaxID=1385520 RepID=A0A0A0J8A7_9MICO|nr:[protein-PII] uridylyltransferase [Knoellia sinensis]KGN31866.1 PII uridylyl-transferase [Knoellia sinensis KCTC 19936]
MTDVTDVAARRLDLAGTRAFETAGSGPERRLRLAEFNREWLTGIWQEATKGSNVEGVALAAVGSVGRGDAGPLSDYDLVLLHYGRTLSADEITRLADRIWYPIWDAGVRLDHSVRTVNQCRAVAADDLTAAVGLLDISAVAGDAEVVAAARATVSHDWRANARKRLPQLTEAMSVRHHRHGDLAQSIEPELKEAHGGLRDMTVLNALAEAWLADRPRGEVDAAYGTLLDVRDAVHVVTGRGRDRLGREDHDAVAALLGYDDPDDLLADVSDAGRAIAYAIDGTVRRAAQSQRARVLRVGPRRPQMRPLGFGLFESDGEVVLGSGRLLDSDPHLPLRAAVLAARANLPIAPVTLENLATKCADLPTPWTPLARGLFSDLLAAGPGLVTVWEGLDQQGIIERWLPEWVAVRSRPQRNAVHRHTVDRHLIETVVHATGLLRGVGRADLLLLAALLHDIGKVPGAHDHSVAGAPIAEAILRRLGHSDADVATVVALVREHLTLIELATRRDHSDPRTIDAAIAAVDGDRDRFELLVALTEADAVAAGPKAWTDWRAALLNQFAAAVRERLSPSTPAAGEAEPSLVPDDLVSTLASGEPYVAVVPNGGSYRIDIADRDRLGLFADTAGLLAAEGLVVRTAVLRTVDGIAVNEWHVESPSDAEPERDRIVRGLMRLASGDRAPLGRLDRRRQFAGRPSGQSTIGTPGQPRALVVPGASQEATVIEVRAQDRPGLLHELGMAFAKAGVSVRSAHIATYAGQTLDTFYVTDFSGRPLDPAKVAQVVGVVIDACDRST